MNRETLVRATLALGLGLTLAGINVLFVTQAADRQMDQDRTQLFDRDRDQLRDTDKLLEPDMDQDRSRLRDRLDEPDQDRDQTRDRDRDRDQIHK